MKSMIVQGLALNLEVRKDDEDQRAISRFDCEEINERGEVIETWEIQFRLDQNQLRCMSVKGRVAGRALESGRDKLDPTRGFKVIGPGLVHDTDDDEDALQ